MCHYLLLASTLFVAGILGFCLCGYLIDGKKARLQALDKITARISTVEALLERLGFLGRWKDGNRCVFHPPEDHLKMLHRYHS